MFDRFPERFQTRLARQTFARLGLLPGEAGAGARADAPLLGDDAGDRPALPAVFHDLLGGGVPERLRGSPLRPLFETAAWAEVIEGLRGLAPAPGLDATAHPCAAAATSRRPW